MESRRQESLLHKQNRSTEAWRHRRSIKYPPISPVRSVRPDFSRSFRRSHLCCLATYCFEIVPAVLTLVAMPITSFALGTWQVYRLQWKKDLIEKYTKNLRQPAIILPKDVGDHTVEELDHRTVLVKGKFRHDQEMLVGPRTRDGILGYHVITPMERENGYSFSSRSMVMVGRQC